MPHGHEGEHRPGTLQKDINRLGKDANHLKDDLQAIGHDAAAIARSGMAEAKDTMHRGIESAREKGIEATDALKDQIVQRPFAAVAIAAGVGVIVGLLISRPRS